MRQFYATYSGDEKVSPLVRRLPWTLHLIILGQTKRPEERVFYILAATNGRWTKRELERQIRARRAAAQKRERRRAAGQAKGSPWRCYLCTDALATWSRSRTLMDHDA